MGYQTCKYRKNPSGEIESRMFDSDEVPYGWLDSPADIPMNGSDPVKVPEAPEENRTPIVKKKRKRRSN